MEEWEGGSQMGGCWDTENESLNNWEMLSNKGLQTVNLLNFKTAFYTSITITIGNRQILQTLFQCKY